MIVTIAVKFKLGTFQIYVSYHRNCWTI